MHQRSMGSCGHHRHGDHRRIQSFWHAIYQNPRMRHDDIVRIEFDGLLKRAFSIAGNGTARNDQDHHAEKMRTRSNIALQPRYPLRGPVPRIAPGLRARAHHGLRQRVRETTAVGRPVRVRNGIGRRPRRNPLIRPLPNQEWARACVRGTCAFFAWSMFFALNRGTLQVNRL